MFKRVINLFKIPIISIVEQYNLSKADYIVVVSGVLKESLIAKGIDESKILTNPNGVDTSKFNPLVDNSNILKSLNLEGKFVYGFIGTFGQWHGVLEIAEAITLFFKKYDDLKDEIRFLLIGDGKLKTSIKKV